MVKNTNGLLATCANSQKVQYLTYNITYLLFIWLTVYSTYFCTYSDYLWSNNSCWVLSQPTTTVNFVALSNFNVAGVSSNRSN